ncbi:MAG: adenylosuccinate synthase [Zhongshania aliphaticivorans]|jgi:adenylosuccinate synthase
MLTPFTSQLIADTGISTGDEGKGRVILEIINELREQTGDQNAVAAVMKVNGGANSGHTVAGLKLNLLPGGVADPHVPLLPIGCGVVADPRKLLWEIAYAEQNGHVALKRLAIDERCLVSDLCHRLLDLAFEDYRVHILKESPRGSTGRGITPAYLDEVGQFQIFYGDFLGPKETFARKMHVRIDRALRTIEHVCQVAPERWPDFFKTLTEAETRAHQTIIESGAFNRAEFDFGQFAGEKPFSLNADALIEAYWQAGQALAAQICDVRESIIKAQEKGHYIIGEFGQAYWLDKRHGFAPNVTASHTFTPEFFQSAGIPVQPVHTIGCCKAYDTKVGTHVFLSEIDLEHPLSKKLRKLEFGATTGRQRMVGWYDAIEKGDALRYGGYQDLVLNKLDTLSHSDDWQGDLQICINYSDPEGKILYHVPRNDTYRRTLKPVYKTVPGWSEDISGIRRFADLPDAARNYVAWLLKALVEVANHGDSKQSRLPNLRYIGVGPEPSQIIKDVPATDELLKLAV